MFSIQNKHVNLPLQPGYFQGCSQYYLRNIWLKIKEVNEGLSFSLISNGVDNQKLKIKLLVGNHSLNKMKNRFRKGQRDFQIYVHENHHHKTLKLVFSNHAIKLINGYEKQPSDQLTDIVGLNFKKIAELHQRKPNFKYEVSLRCYSAINSLIQNQRFIIYILGVFIFAKTLQMGSQVLDDLGINTCSIALALLAIAVASAIKRSDLIPAINKGPSTRGVNCSVGNRYFSCFHIQNNMITVYKNPLFSQITPQFDEIVYKDLSKEYFEKNIDLKLKNIMPFHEEHMYLHNFSDFSRLPFCEHAHIQFKGVPAITPDIFDSFIIRLTAQDLIDASASQSIRKKFKKAFLS